MPTNSCIVTWIDLIGIKRKLIDSKPEALAAMEKFRGIIEYNTNNGQLENHAHSYTLNDSAILLAFPPRDSFTSILKELQRLKVKIDAEVMPSFVVCVHGNTIRTAFPPQPLVFDGQISDGPRYTHIKASSIAFANCHIIDATLKHTRMDWYIDSRITKMSDLRVPDRVEEVEMLPSRIGRPVHLFKDVLFAERS
jgi:hypothetical protein